MINNLMLKIMLPILSGSLESSTIVTGTKNLLTDAARVLAIISGLAAVVCVIAYAVMHQFANPQDAATWKKRIVAVLVCAVVGVTAGVIITVVTGYYQ